MKKSLKPNGQMLIVMPGKKPYNLGVALKHTAHSEKWKTYFPGFKEQRIYFTPEEYLALLEDAGLTVVSIKASDAVSYYKNREALFWVRPLVNCADHLSLDLRKSFTEDIADYIITFEQPNADGVIGLHDQKLEIIAEIKK